MFPVDREDCNGRNEPPETHPMLRLRRWLFRNPVAPHRAKPVRSTRLNAEQLENREVPAGLTTTFSFTGNVGAEVAAAAVPGDSGSYNLFTLDEIPAGATVLHATVHSLDWFALGASTTLDFAGVRVGGERIESSPGGLSVHSWDVTPLVRGGGAYPLQVDGAGYQYGVVLAVAFTAPGLPFGTVSFNTGAVEVAIGHSGPDAASTSMSLATGGAYTLSVLTVADDALEEMTGEQVLFNGAVVGGPLDANLGPAASLVTASVTAVAGTNTVGITTNDDWIGWSLAVLAPTAGVAPPNQPPVAAGDSLTTRFGRPGSANVLTNDSDPDGDPLTVASYTQPANGSVAVDSTGLATYTPNAGFSGSDSFTYSVADGKGGTATGSVAVTVAPPPTVTVTSSGTASEAGATARLTFARTDTAGDLVVNFAVGGTAVPGSKNDYTLSAVTLVGGVGTVTIPDGQSSVTVDLTAVDDPWFEPTETATFDVAGGTGYVAGGSAAKVDVLDDDAATTTVSLVPTYLTLDEGKSGTLTVRRTGGSSASLAATVQLANNPAVAVRAGLNSDYTLTDAAGNPVVVTSSKFPVAFADGQSEVSFTVAATGDNRVEPDEGVRFQLLSGGTAFAIGNKTSDLTVRDATPQVSITPASRDLTEGGFGSFTVTRTGSTAGALAVSVRVEANPAFPTRAGWNSDYTLSLADGTPLAVSGGAFTVTIPDGQASALFDLKAKADGVIEATEGVRLRVASGSTYAAASGYSSADVSIADATPQVSISPSTAEVAEGASGTLTLTRTGDTSSSLVVTLRAETNPAFPTRAAWNTDYTLYSLTLPDGTPVPLVGGAFTVTIPAGQSSLSLSVNGLPDNKTEATEGVRFRVAGNTVYAAKPGEATADIALLDRTPVVTISPNALTVPEGSSGSFTVTWTGDTSDTSSDRVVTLQLATNPGVTGRATWNTDYTLQAGGQTLSVSGGRFTVTIPAGSNSQTVSIVANTDARVEGPEGVRVQVATGTVYASGGSPLDAVIADDPPTVSVTASTNAAEGGAAGTFTLTRSGGDLSLPLTAYFTLGGTASKVWDYKVSGATYVASRGQYRVTFPASSTGSPTSVVVTLPTVDGDCPELDETVELTVASDSPRYVASASQGQRALTIVDNDVTPDMVAPGKTWTDGSSVTVFNPGGTWLRASVVSSGWVQLSPVSCSETGPATQNNYFAVVSGLNGFDGDATWVGDVGGLSLTATGDIFDITISGRVTLDAGQTVGDVNAATVVSVSATGSVSAVTAQSQIGAVFAGVDIGTVVAGTTNGGAITGSIVAGGQIESVTVYGTGGQAGWTSSTVPLVDQDADFVRAAWSETADQENAPAFPESRPTLPSLPTGGYLGGSVIAVGNIGSVRVFGELVGDVRSTGGSIGAASGAIGVWAAGSISGAVSSTVGVLGVQSWESILGSVIASDTVSVWAYEEVGGSLISSTGDVLSGAWGRITSAVVNAAQAVRVFAWDAVGTPPDRVGSVILTAGQKDVQVIAGKEVSLYDSISADGSLTIDSGGFVRIVGNATAKTNLWVAARGGNISGSFKATDGWGYVWAQTDFNGELVAKGTASATAGSDLKAKVRSTDDGAEAYSGRDVLGEIEGKWWAEVRAGESVDASVTSTDGDVRVTAGKDIKKKISANGDAELLAAGEVSGGASASRGYLEVTANGLIFGDFTARDDLELRGGKDVTVEAIGASSVRIVASGNVSGRGVGIRSTGAEVSVQAGGSLYSSIDAAGDAFVEVGENILGDGLKIKAGKDVSVLVGGNIDAAVEIESEWVADVRSAGGEVNASIKTRKTGWLTDPTSPAVDRLKTLDAEIARRQQELQNSTNPNSIDAGLAILARLRAEREALTFGEKKIDYKHIPASVVQGLVSDKLAIESNEPAYRSRSMKGYVVLADMIGNDAYVMVLEPFRYLRIRKPRPFPEDNITDTVVLSGVENADYGESAVGGTDPAEYYKVVYQKVYTKPDAATSPEAWQQYAYGSGENALWKASLRVMIDDRIAENNAKLDALLKQTLSFGMSLVPLVGAYQDYKEGNYTEAAISLAGDAAMIVGFGAALKARKCVVAGRDLTKIAFRASTAVEGGIAAFRLGQGIDAYANGDTSKAYGYFGDATLRLLGLSAQSVAWLKNKAKCFVAGTPVHTTDGVKPIEQVAAGERVWAFDRQAQQWRLSQVTRTFENVFSGIITTAELSDGTTLTGTDGHPAWVVEGADLLSRGRPDHGADEPVGPTPGRWVPLGHLRVEDVVLTRSGVARVVRVDHTEGSGVRVYNFEVEGLHSYAVGATGLLTHNHGGGVNECSLGDWPTGAKASPHKQPSPGLQKPDAAPAAKTAPSVESRAVKEKVAPTGGTPAPVKQAQHPRGENVHVRAGNPIQRVSPVTDKAIRDAIQPKFQAWEDAKQAVQQAKSKGLDTADPVAFSRLRDKQREAARAYGEAGAEAFMSKRIPAAQKVHTGQNGSHDLDFVYHDPATGKYYVVEAKGGTAARNTTNANRGKFDANGDPLSPRNVQQGSKDYLDAQIDYMKSLPDTDPRKLIGVQLDAARDANKIAYLEVHAKKLTADSGPSLMVSQWLGPASL